jgi:STE24 endopeptidase
VRRSPAAALLALAGAAALAALAGAAASRPAAAAVARTPPLRQAPDGAARPVAARGSGARADAPAAAYFDPEFLRRSEGYNRAQLAFALNARAIRWAAYLTLALAPFIPRLARRLERRFPRAQNLRVLILAWVVLLAVFLAVLPISFASGHVLEHRYGLSRQTALGWFSDALKGVGLWGAAISLLTVLYFVLRRRLPRAGWIVLAAATVLLVAAATFLYPLVVDPLFHRFRELDDPDLRRDLVLMADAEGIRLDRVLVMEASAKTVRENAYFTGLGRTKRVVLWDNLVENAAPAELRRVFAHELGHWSRGHVGRGLLLGAAALPLLCWALWSLHGRLSRVRRLGLDGPADPAGIPVLWLLLSLALALGDPVVNAVSRGFEREADRVALELTGDPEGTIEGLRRAAVVNLAWVDPPEVWKWIFWTHPTTLERIRMAEAWRERGAS